MYLLKSNELYLFLIRNISMFNNSGLVILGFQFSEKRPVEVARPLRL